MLLGAVLTELRNRGVKDVLFACCDVLNGLPDAIEATWPKAIVQTCVIHLIRASTKYVSWNERKKVAAALRPIYTAVNDREGEAAANAAIDNLRAGFGKKYPGLLPRRRRRDQAPLPRHTQHNRPPYRRRGTNARRAPSTFAVKTWNGRCQGISTRSPKTAASTPA